MAKPFGKRPGDYLVLQTTKELIIYLNDRYQKNGNVNFQAVITEKGGGGGGNVMLN